MKKQLFGFLAIIIALSASAFTTVKSSAHRTAVLHWYTVDYSSNPSGVINSSSDEYTVSEKSQVVSPCDEGTQKDCLRGFTNELTSFPTTAMGADQIKRPNE
ncbi:hypothetical protein [Mucilaginibacter ginkgonis]|uniref:Uncharacterized protein n=1 Tax=Mucilaginibacter ginkgonis TaxID=2682091 RepID=A0A6I4HV88_9SPHI|nr:hypothetical protein [Mucilaginibacter ginkgonis]QQL49890.1 hypothetical protein GO620_000115 [Mucilaginibacter ginkgonis]